MTYPALVEHYMQPGQTFLLILSPQQEIPKITLERTKFPELRSEDVELSS